jgi:hypothetical protein
MLKYRNQRTHKPETLLSTLLSFLQVGLVTVGLIGLSVRLFEDKGWFKQVLGRVMRAEFAQIAIAAVMLVIAGYLMRGWMHSGGEEQQSRIADAMLYLMMLVGAYFVFNLVTAGSF